jgi:hypothetical protein
MPFSAEDRGNGGVPRRAIVAGGGEVAGRIIGRVIQPLMVGPLRRYRPIGAAVVAAGLVQLAFTAPRGVTILSSEQIVAAVEPAA